MTFQSEQELEELLIAQLQKQGYDTVTSPNENSLKANFRSQLNKLTVGKLQGEGLTDKEFTRVMIHLEGKSIFNSSKLFRDKFVLERDDGTSIYIEFFDSKNLKHHGLVQAFLRTNRVFDATKPYGNVVCYRNLKKDTDVCVKLRGGLNGKR